ncbi:hypothetical protein [Sphingomonas hylomeconis]|uniref:Pectate lyase superfamily protein domain-containing protein n=1 Tax=Sphingomonas hylomeconis TaxID=1395958 RepID=A0ABV7SQB4_9SPHN|nr:hypothetical protein [Sphingomonas hylomeconis]
MATAARLPLAAWRNELCVRTIRFVGLDLTGVDMRMQIRLRPDAPGAPLIALATVTTASAEGLKLDSVTTVAGIPTSTVVLRINKTTMTNAAMVPYGGEPGADTGLSYAIQLGGTSVGATRVYGPFIVLANVMDSDGAPTGLVSGYGNAASGMLPWSAAQLTFGDDVINISIDGIDLLAPLVAAAQAARDAVIPTPGLGPPSNSFGINGSTYYDTTNPLDPIFYGPKANGVWGTGRSLRGPTGAPGGNFLSSKNVQASPYFALPGVDTTAGAAAVKSGIATACTDANTAGVGILLPAGSYLAENTTITSGGVVLTAADNTSLEIRGEGRTSIIKRRAIAGNTIASGGANALVWLRGNQGASYVLRDFVVDGNERNYPFSITSDPPVDYVATAGQTDFAYPSAIDYVGIEAFTRIGGIWYAYDFLDYAIIGTGASRIVRFHTARTAGEEVRIGDPWYFEQTANIRHLSGTGTIKSITIQNFSSTGEIGDGYFSATPSEELTITNFKSYGRTVRPRSSIQLSRIANVSNVSDFIVDGFEMEPALTPDGAVINLTNGYIRGPFDCAGDAGSSGNRPNMFITNVVSLSGQNVHPLKYNNFYNVYLRMFGGQITSVSRVQRCDAIWFGTRVVQDPRDLDNGVKDTFRSVEVWHDESFTRRQRVEWRNCDFVIPTGVTKGNLIDIKTIATVLKASTILKDCNMIGDGALDYILVGSRFGELKISGGNLAVKKAMASVGADTGYVFRYVLSEMENWDGRVAGVATAGLVEVPVGVTAASAEIIVSGTFDTAKILPFGPTGTLPRTEPVLKWGGNAIAIVDASPVGILRGWPGLRARLRVPGIGVNEWVYQNATAGRIGEVNSWVPVPTRLAQVSQLISGPGGMAANAITSEMSITVATAALGMTARITASPDLDPGLEICAVRGVAGAVKFRVRNMTAAGVTLNNTTYTANIEVPA